VGRKGNVRALSGEPRDFEAAIDRALSGRDHEL